MSDEIARELYNNYLITIHKNETNKDGKYRAYGRKLLGQASTLEGEIKLPSYTLFGDDPDQLIENIKSKHDQDFNN